MHFTVYLIFLFHSDMVLWLHM